MKSQNENNQINHTCGAVRGSCARHSSSVQSRPGRCRAFTYTRSRRRKEGPFSGEVGTALTNAYIFNGLVQDKDTFIAQPYLTLNFMLYEGEGFLNDASFTLISVVVDSRHQHTPRLKTATRVSRIGTSSISVRVLASPSPRTGVSRSATTFTPRREITSTTSHNLSLAFEYDDSDLLGAFALHPHFYFQQELTNHAGLAFKDGVPFASDAPEGQYYELGIGPSYTFGEKSTYPVTVTLPTAAGFGSNGFYGQGFGYFSTGAEVSVPLGVYPEQLRILDDLR